MVTGITKHFTFHIIIILQSCIGSSIFINKLHDLHGLHGVILNLTWHDMLLNVPPFEVGIWWVAVRQGRQTEYHGWVATRPIHILDISSSNLGLNVVFPGWFFFFPRCSSIPLRAAAKMTPYIFFIIYSSSYHSMLHNLSSSNKWSLWALHKFTLATRQMRHLVAESNV